jgi:hypothetical protein
MEDESTTTTPENGPETEQDGTQDAPDEQAETDEGSDASATSDAPEADTGNEQLQSELTRARKDAARYRRQLRELQGKQQQGSGTADTDTAKRKVIDAVGVDAARALGIELPAEKTDDATARRLADAESAARQARVETAVLREAARQGVDGDALLDSRSFIGSLADFDPSDSDFASQVADAIKDNGKAGRKAAQQRQAPARSGTGQTNGAPGGQRQWTAEQVKRATPDQMTKAMKAGLLRDYLSTPG